VQVISKAVSRRPRGQRRMLSNYQYSPSCPWWNSAKDASIVPDGNISIFNLSVQIYGQRSETE